MYSLFKSISSSAFPWGPVGGGDGGGSSVMGVFVMNNFCVAQYYNKVVRHSPQNMLIIFMLFVIFWL